MIKNGMVIGLLTGQLWLHILFPDTELRYAYRPNPQGSIEVIVTYPLGDIQKVCTLMQRESDGATVGEHCWVPSNEVSDIDPWEDWNMEGLFVVVNAIIRKADGTTETQWAWPIELENDQHGVVEVR